ncbi:hypothetical protein SDC9_167743 [bioreactor metagenome]|uniref:Uncharacterized protein n=1 Tax=bioreactor metagenome TaxID=1076179 RepID=A0A645G8D3_9ZZZZ
MGAALPGHQVFGFADEARADAEGGIPLLAARDTLEHQVAGSAFSQRFHLGGDMGQHADLRGDPVLLLQLLKPREDGLHAGAGRVHRVEADDRVARAVGKPFQHGGSDALHIVGGVVGLQPHGQGAGLADGGDAGGFHAHFGGGVDEVQIAHQLADRGDHLAGQAAAQPLQLPGL